MNCSREIILVTGAAKSGKSEWAEMLATQKDQPVIYIATAINNPEDSEWTAKIEQHRQRRLQHWQTLEIPFELATVIEQSYPPHCLLIDSLGTWVANLLNKDTQSWEIINQQLLKALKTSVVDIILVAEETGWGVVPAYESGRLFRDRLGILNRQVGIIADVVYLVTSGHALNLTQLGQRLI